MSSAAAGRRLQARLLFGLGVSALAGVWVLGWLNRHVVPPSDWGSAGGGLAAALFTSATFTFGVVGFVLVSRLPHNRLGWFLLGAGVFWSISMAADQYAVYGMFTAPGTVPHPEFVLAATTWSWIPGITLMGAFPVLLFPDGNVPSPRWLWAYRLCAWATILPSVAVLIGPSTLSDLGYPHLENPFHVGSPASGWLVVTIILVPSALLAAAASLVVRYRRSQGQERLQLKWLVAAGSAVALTYLVTMLVLMLGAPRATSDEVPRALQLLQDVSLYSFILIPMAIGIAVLRYRLYSIDVIIKRSLLYAGLTGLLTAAYLGSTAVLQATINPVTGDSGLAVAGSTLAVAGLFRPLRTRLQRFIDERFDRARYDAEQTIRSFAGRMRDEVDLGAISDDLVTVAYTVMHPRGVNLWLPPR